jgi:hypothetical protein
MNITPDYHVAMVRHWTGREAKALRAAVRLSVRDFAEQLGIGARTVSKWEARGPGVSLRPAMQAVLDATLERASHQAKARFTLLAAASLPAIAVNGTGGLDSPEAPTMAQGSGQQPEASSDVGGGLNGNGHAGLTTGVVSDAEAVRGLLMSSARRERECHYTLHLDFAIDSPAAARAMAVALAEGLGILRAEVQTYSAQVSAGGRWGDAEPVFCMADGPEGAFCGYPAGHPGWHAEAGVDGLRWGDGDGARG